MTDQLSTEQPASLSPRMESSLSAPTQSPFSATSSAIPGTSTPNIIINDALSHDYPDLAQLRYIPGLFVSRHRFHCFSPHSLLCNWNACMHAIHAFIHPCCMLIRPVPQPGRFICIVTRRELVRSLLQHDSSSPRTPSYLRTTTQVKHRYSR